MAKTPADIVISWYADGKEAQAALTGLTRPYKLIGMPAGPGHSYIEQRKQLGETMIQAICAKYAPDIKPLRVALMGFSEGCAGVREAISSGDGPRIDAVLAIDGIHAMWTDKKSKAKIDTSGLVKWKAFAKSAIADGRLCCITTSAIVPPYVSTTITSDWIWQQSTGSAEVTFDVPAPSAVWEDQVSPPYIVSADCRMDKVTGKKLYCWPETAYYVPAVRLYRKKGGLVIWNYLNRDPSGIGDHRFQSARVTPLMINTYLLPRWNGTDPASGITLV